MEVRMTESHGGVAVVAENLERDESVNLTTLSGYWLQYVRPFYSVTP
ncbi:hypothetical protein HanRHA438_Chr09g0394221 [Helianthus annuus]|nr:hypothetical protein HanRHA438_Chr09g0394221 [Helianthus annuus]